MKRSSCVYLSTFALLQAFSAAAISPNAVELELAGLIAQHPDQQRAEMVYDPALHLVARAKVLDLAERAYFAHVDPDGYGPNKAVTLAGYGLPAWWGDANDLNYIESLNAGHVSAAAAFEGWMKSPGHRAHILADHSFYTGQTRYGVGYANVPGSPYRRYYAFISAPPSTGGDQELEPYTEWLFTHYKPIEIDLDEDETDTNGNGVPRIIEFALDFDPGAAAELPMPVFNFESARLEWALPVRPDLGSVTFEVQHVECLKAGDWSANGIEISADSPFVAAMGAGGFFRLRAARE